MMFTDVFQNSVGQQHFKMQKQFTITKKIAKHGNQAIICIPKVLESELKPGMLVEIKIETLKN
jgi:hypothetical protein